MLKIYLHVQLKIVPGQIKKIIYCKIYINLNLNELEFKFKLNDPRKHLICIVLMLT